MLPVIAAASNGCFGQPIIGKIIGENPNSSIRALQKVFHEELLGLSAQEIALHGWCELH